ncbi:MAG: 23S rRNA (pseudouridine(1915)-N(3))-methyltransferase RlmH [Litorimonas sp.]
MKIILRAGGIMRSGPERDMVDDYITRAQGLARATGFISVSEDSIDLRAAKTRPDETLRLLDGIPNQAHIIVLDERGKTPTSRQIAKKFEGWRDDGVSATYLLIGGADGFDPDTLKNAAPSNITRWALGPQTWPHKLVRVMAAEQIYRALSIMARTPYHRD